MRAGATFKLGSVVARTIDDRVVSASVRTSYIDFSIVRRSRYDIDELPWGSRSIRRVLRFFWERAAARLMAVVVFPTPPFWFAIVMIIGGAADHTKRRS